MKQSPREIQIFLLPLQVDALQIRTERLDGLGGNVQHFVGLAAVKEVHKAGVAQGLELLERRLGDFELGLGAFVHVEQEHGDLLVGAPALRLVQAPYAFVGEAGDRLADLVREILRRIPGEERPHAGEDLVLGDRPGESTRPWWTAVRQRRSPRSSPVRFDSCAQFGQPNTKLSSCHFIVTFLESVILIRIFFEILCIN